jgi:hypothetical protein
MSANFTVVNPDAAGCLTVDCAATIPTVRLSTSPPATAPNLASALDATGGVCHRHHRHRPIVDASGYFGTSGSARYTRCHPPSDGHP